MDKMQNKNVFKKCKKLFVFILVFICVVSSYAMFINPILVNTVRFEANKLTTSAINKAINQVVSDAVIYNDLINITYSTNGKINLIQARSLEINRIRDEIAITAENNLTGMGSNGVFIPFGNFLGISLFTGRGPKINIKAIPIGNVICSFTSKFESAGINQTLHKIYLNVDATVGFVIPFLNNKFSTQQDILICENIFIGEVPLVYFNSNHLQSLLNFVPN